MGAWERPLSSGRTEFKVPTSSTNPDRPQPLPTLPTVSSFGAFDFSFIQRLRDGIVQPEPDNQKDFDENQGRIVVALPLLIAVAALTAGVYKFSPELFELIQRFR